MLRSLEILGVGIFLFLVVWGRDFYRFFYFLEMGIRYLVVFEIGSVSWV